MGKKKQPHYRIVVADSRSPRDGRFVENLGYYNPLPSPAVLSLDLARVDYWLGQGASPSDTVDRLVRKARSGGGGDVALVGASEPAEEHAEDGGGGVEAAVAEPAGDAPPAEVAADAGTVAEAAPA